MSTLKRYNGTSWENVGGNAPPKTTVTNSNTDTYSCNYLNNKLNVSTQALGTTATFYKIGNIVIVVGWLVLNSASKTFTAPYKPALRTWVPVNGVTNTPSASSSNGYIDIQTNGTMDVKMTSAVTYCTTGFCYITSD